MAPEGRSNQYQQCKYFESTQQLLIPLEVVNIEEQGPGRVAVVGGVDLASGELVNQPAVNGAEGELATPGGRAEFGAVSALRTLIFSEVLTALST